jgi:O-antigen/teichoic acid export membrane protein
MLLISSFFNLTILGFYSFAFSIIQRPLTIIGTSVTQVFYQKAAVSYNQNENVWKITKEVILKLILIALPIFIPILIFAPEIFSYIFGEKWLEAGIYAQIITPWLFMKFISSPISSVPQILNKQREFLFISLFINITNPCILLSMSIAGISFKLSLTILSIFVSTSLFLVILWIRSISK